MRNLAEKWPVAPDWQAATLRHEGLGVRTLAGLNQLLVSGDLAAWQRVSGMPQDAVGATDVATGDRYAARLARDRMLVVAERPLAIEAGWHAEGFAVTAMDAALHVFEISGKGARELFVRATTLDPDGRSASASLLFAGIGAVVYRFGGVECLRVHVDRALAPYLWEWLQLHASGLKAAR